MIEMLSDMFGSDCIGKLIRGNTISVTVDDKVATVNVESLVSSLRCYFTATSTLRSMNAELRRLIVHSKITGNLTSWIVSLL